MASTAEAAKPETADGSRRRVIAVLAEWRDIIGLALFFGGGAAWIYGAFATKQYVNETACLLRNQHALTRAELQMRFILNDLTENGLRLAHLASRKTQLTPFEQKEQQRIEAEQQMLREKLAAEQNTQRNVLERMQSQSCT